MERVEATLPQTTSGENDGIEALKEILSSPQDNFCTPALMCDLDYTIKERSPTPWVGGRGYPIHLETVAALIAVYNAGVKLGVLTEQSFSQLMPFIEQTTQLASGIIGDHSLFNGLIVGEGGSVVSLNNGASIEEGLTFLVSDEIRCDIETMRDWLQRNITPIPGDNWGGGVLDGVDLNEGVPVKLPDEPYQGMATISLWEQGPHITEDPSYQERYNVVLKRIKEVMERLGIDGVLQAYEGGNGVDRITPRNCDKAQSMSLLAQQEGFDLEKIVFACDGPNDVGCAKIVGGVIAVSNAVPSIHEIATYSATQPSGLGVAEAISILFPEQYHEALESLNRIARR